MRSPPTTDSRRKACEVGALRVRRSKAVTGVRWSARSVR